MYLVVIYFQISEAWLYVYHQVAALFHTEVIRPGSEIVFVKGSHRPRPLNPFTLIVD